jgi:uncharacterized membrane protein
MRQLQFLKSHFLAGLFVLIPFGVIGWILLGLFEFLWNVHLLLPPNWRPESFSIEPPVVILLNFLLILLLGLVVLVGISVLGWVSKQYLGKKALQWLGEIIRRIPVIRSIYSSLDQLLKTLAAGGGQQFSRVVYIEYPRRGAWALAFVTGPATGPAVPSGHLNVYVPTTPNPTSGFHLIVPENEVRESHLKVEEAFKTILSLGIAQGSEPTAND